MSQEKNTKAIQINKQIDKWVVAIVFYTKGERTTKFQVLAFSIAFGGPGYVSWFGLGCGILQGSDQGKTDWHVRSLSADREEEGPTIWMRLAEGKGSCQLETCLAQPKTSQAQLSGQMWGATAWGNRAARPAADGTAERAMGRDGAAPQDFGPA